jgi:hypothetical protein
MNSPILKKLLPHIGAIIFFLILTSAYFYPQIQGERINQSDIMASVQKSKEVKDYVAETGRNPLWSNSIFAGSPSYYISLKYPGNKLNIIDKAVKLFSRPPIGMFFALLVTFYLMAVFLGISPWIGILSSVVFAFTTNNFLLLEAGHNSKLSTIVWFGFITSGFILSFRKKYLAGGILFAIGLGLSIYSKHVQMIYYLFMCLAILGVIYLIEAIKTKQYNSFLKALGVLFIGGILAVGANASHLWTSYEYQKATMRGEPILEKQANQNASTSSSETDGLAWDYAMQWSNGIEDVFAMLVPRAAGGASGEAVSDNTRSYDLLKRNNVKPDARDTVMAPMYWGKLPFTGGPSYMGAAVFFLFILGLLLSESKLKWWLGLAVLLTVLISFGKNIEWFQKIFFNYFPLYNKFRTPSSALTITSFFMALSLMFTLPEILKRKTFDKIFFRKLFIALGITGGLTLILALLGSSLFSFTSPGDARYDQGVADIFIQDRKTLLSSDAWRSFGIILLSAAAIVAYGKSYIKKPVLLGLLTLITIADLWTVGKRYVNVGDFVSGKQWEQNLNPRPVDQQIAKAEKSRIDYRVLDLSINTFNDNSTSYFHNTIGGYHPAKLQRMQDLIEKHISRGNQGVLDMLNTKYIISPQGQTEVNSGALGNAWFVDDIVKVNSANEEIDALTGFDPVTTAIVLDEEFNNYIGSFDPERAGTIKLTNYELDTWEYETDAPSEQLAVFSEIWYGNENWDVSIDGNPVDHIRANYALRALRVPAGKHVVKFVFKPKSYYTGETISLIASIILLLGALVSLYFLFKKNWDKWNKAKTASPVSKKKTVKKKLGTKKKKNPGPSKGN